MAKRIKMVLYGEPGAGKSTFASKAPNPFFITTDGNYEWLGLPEKDHKQVFNWEEAKRAFAATYKGYDTIVVDLLEDLYKLCQADYCRRNNIDYVGDDDYGKGWRITKDEFFMEVAKLLGQDKNVILIMHESVTYYKDRRGNDKMKYKANDRIHNDVIDQIEGRVRYFVRCYMQPEVEGERTIKRRYLSLIPKENEFGIARGIDEYSVPHDIDLDWDAFVAAIGFTEEVVKEPVKEVKPTTEVADVNPPVNETPAVATVKEEPVVKEPVAEEPVKVEPAKVEEPAPAPVEPAPVEESREDRLARLRAKLNANNK